MDSKEAILAAMKKSDTGRSRRLKKLYNSPASPDKLIRVFASTFRDTDYGTPPPVTVHVRGMLSGFIKVCRSSNWEESKIYETIKHLVVHWDYIKLQDHHTLKNNRQVKLGDRPSLLEFLICRETILSAIELAGRDNITEVTTSISEVTVVEKRKQFAPSEDDMQADYERQMEEY